MSPDGLRNELERIGRSLSRWQAEVAAAIWGAAVFLCLSLFGFSDLVFRFERNGRMLTCSILVALATIGFRRFLIEISRKRTPEGIAATVEKTFPELDNHLINVVQFSGDSSKDLLKKAYIHQGVPGWPSFPFARMKNRRVRRWSFLFLAAAAMAIAVPFALAGPAWAVSLARILNPFSNREPVSLTRILRVTPGNASVRQGDAVTLACEVQGRKGHRVELEIQPADNQPTTRVLGRVAGASPQSFSNRIARVTTDFKYRFHAGDAPNPKWQTVKARPPLAFTSVALTIEPPAYTRLQPQTTDASTNNIRIPQGSKVTVNLTCNSPVVSASMAGQEGIPVPLAEGPTLASRQGVTNIESGTLLTIAAANADGEQAETTVRFETIPDRLPTIRILSPAGRSVLGPDGKPAIQFEVEDDYGIASVAIERMTGRQKSERGTAVTNWTAIDSTSFAALWKDGSPRAEAGRPTIFRVSAQDQASFGDRTTRSSPVIFDALSTEQASARLLSADTNLLETLNTLVNLQRENLGRTRALEPVVVATTPEQWNPALECQKRIRALANALLRNPRNPLGAMTPVVKQLYMEEMSEAITVLSRISSTAGNDRKPIVQRAMALEDEILRKLDWGRVAGEKTVLQRRISNLLSLLENLMTGEKEVVAGTAAVAARNTRPGQPLVDRQDRLADDTAAFIKTCRLEAPGLEPSNKAFSELIVKVAGLCESRKVKEAMLQAAEKLDANTPKVALPLEQKALTALQDLHTLMNQWQVGAAEERLEQVVEALQDAKEKMQKVRKLESKLLDAMKLTETQKDRSDKDMDLMEEEAAEIQKNIREALLQIPIDLQIFNELNVCNELVEDVFTVFEDTVQLAGSEKMTAADVAEVGVLKLESMIEAMKKTEGRMDAVETWLAEKPDSFKWNTEAFDREEQPKLALGALSTETEDLIGDLLKESEDAAKAADDSATNADAPAMDDLGWEVAEGSIAGFGAQGKSGNQAPDHKEQSGRSNVGRQGMASGETAAGSGTIGEGDKNIAKRVTPDPLQSGQVQADGDADEVATGGGKQGSGSADEMGMAGTGSNRRMDSKEQGSIKGLEALMAKTQALHVKTSLLNLRTESLGAAAHHMRQASDAIASGQPISELREHQRRAQAALVKARTELRAGAGAALSAEEDAPPLEDVAEENAANAPADYRNLVADYYKSLGETL